MNLVLYDWLNELHLRELHAEAGRDRCGAQGRPARGTALPAMWTAARCQGGVLAGARRALAPLAASVAVCRS